jgi:NDP-sugar pyrophosphorylase family protein
MTQVDGMIARGVVQAGGRGSRMGESSREIPKPLLEVAGVPMVERVVRRMAAAGIDSITIIVNWLGGRIQEHFAGLDDIKAEVAFFHEEQPLGTIGALSLLPRDPRLVVWSNGDLVSDLDFRRFVAIHRRRAAALTLASHYETTRLQLGELSVAGDAVLDYLEKPEKRYLICSGMAVIDPELIALLVGGEPAGLPDLVQRTIAAGHRVEHWEHGALWFDVNTPRALVEVERVLRERQDGSF